MTPSRRALLALTLTLAGCPGPAATPDASTDGGASDAGTFTDTPVRDDAPPDAGPSGGLGGATGIRFPILSRPIDLTPDGALAVLEDPNTGDVSTLDVDSGVLSPVTNVGDPARDFSTGVSATGRITAHHGVPIEAGVWSAATDWIDLPSPFDTGCGDDVASAWDVSADGTLVAGMAWETCGVAAVRWTLPASGTPTATPLERLGVRAAGGSGPPANRATAISDDGSVIGGFAENDLVDRWPAVWRADGTGFLLPGTVPDAPGEVLAVSADGRVVAGTWNLEAFVWTEADGVVSIGRLPTAFGGDTAYANAIAADGALVFGGCGGFGATEAFVWTEAGGMRPLAEVLSAAGVEVPAGTLLTNVIAASNDGTLLLGSASTASGTPESFVARLPLSAYGL